MLQSYVLVLTAFAATVLANGPVPELQCKGKILSDCKNKGRCVCHATGHGGTPDCVGSGATRLMEQCVQQCTCRYPTPPPPYDNDCPPDYATGKKRKKVKGKCVVMRKRDAEPEPEPEAWAEPEAEAEPLYELGGDFEDWDDY